MTGPFVSRGAAAPLDTDSLSLHDALPILGAIGVGAVSGASILPRLKAALGPDRIVLAGTVITVPARTMRSGPSAALSRGKIDAPLTAPTPIAPKIGRASCRERESVSRGAAAPRDTNGPVIDY